MGFGLRLTALGSILFGLFPTRFSEIKANNLWCPMLMPLAVF